MGPETCRDTRMQMGHVYCTMCVWDILYARGLFHMHMGQNMHMVHNTSTSQGSWNAVNSCVYLMHK